MKKAKSAFTLIEVMVAVMIISVVIMALIKMYSNNTHLFSIMKKQVQTNQYSSLLIANEEYGFLNKNIRMYDLVKDFDLEFKLRRELKDMKAKIIYQELESIDLSESSGEESESESEDYQQNENEASSGLVLEMGNSVIKMKNASNAILRLRIK